MNRIKPCNVNNTAYIFTINDTTDSNDSISNIETNKHSKYSDTSYQPSTTNDSKSSSLNNNIANRENHSNKINYIRPNLKKNKRIKKNSNITSPTSEIQKHKLRQNTDIILKNEIYTPSIRLHPQN